MNDHCSILEVDISIFERFPTPDDFEQFNIYKEFILNCLNLRVNKYFIYSDCHHILPVCIGGSDEGNRIFLTYKEHFLAHYYLAKAYYQNYELLYTINMMGSVVKYNVSNIQDYSDKYAEARKLYIDAFRKRVSGENNHMKRPEMREKFSKITSDRMNTPEMKLWWLENNPMKNEESRLAVRDSKEGRIWVNNGKDMKQIFPDELDSYINKGYINRGMIKTKTTRRKDYDCLCKNCGINYKGGKYSRLCKNCLILVCKNKMYNK